MNESKYIPLHEDQEYIKLTREVMLKNEKEAKTLRKRAESLLKTAALKEKYAADNREFLREVERRKKALLSHEKEI
jgi:hypothetical protein